MLISTSNCFKDYKIARARVDYLHEKRNKESQDERSFGSARALLVIYTRVT